MPRILDHLTAARSQQFVGRDDEQTLFAKAIVSPELPFFLLHVSGPGGVGKTALLHAFAARCGQQDINTLYFDVRNVQLTPQGFTDGLRSVLGAASRNGLQRDHPHFR